MHSPNDFMYQEFLEHKRIFNMDNKWDYMMLSSGTNQFPMPKLWKELIVKEINIDYTYQLYVSPYGFETTNQSIKLYENFISTKGDFASKIVNENSVCMTIGSSQAASLVMDYLVAKNPNYKIIIVGKNYALYEMLSRKCKFEITQVTSRDKFIPNIDELLKYIESCSENCAFIFSHPNNPSGEQYSQEEYDKITLLLKEKNCFAIFDEVCNMIISNNELVIIETSITQAKYWDNCVIINSFSKTESIPGFRLGYVYSDKSIINYIFQQQSYSLMSVPSVLVLPVFFTCLFRCMFLNNKYSWNRYDNKRLIRIFRLIFYVTTSIPDNLVKNIVEDKFYNISSHYNAYVQELLNNDNSIKENFRYLLEKLDIYIVEVSSLKSGFNFMIKLKYIEKFTELEFVSDLLKETGLAVLTESAFSLENNKESSFWFRISLACPNTIFKKAIDKLLKYITVLEQEYETENI